MPKRIPGVTDMTPSQKKMYTTGATQWMKEDRERKRYERAMGSQADIVARGNRVQGMESSDSKVLRSSGTGYGSYRNR